MEGQGDYAATVASWAAAVVVAVGSGQGWAEPGPEGEEPAAVGAALPFGCNGDQGRGALQGGTAVASSGHVQ